MRKLLVLVLLAPLLNSCASGPNQLQQMKTRFVGKSEASLLSCVGAPTSSQVSGQTKVLTYRSKRLIANQHHLYNAWCVMHFTVQDGQITNMRSRAYGPLINRYIACDQITAACL